MKDKTLRARLLDASDSADQECDDLVDQLAEKIEFKTFTELLKIQEKTDPSHEFTMWLCEMAIKWRMMSEMQVSLELLR